MKRLTGIAVIILLIGMMAGCGTRSGVQTESAAVTTAADGARAMTEATMERSQTSAAESQTATDGGTSDEPATAEKGAQAEAFTVPGRGVRPIAVMIDNEGTRPLPQGGLHLAQLIYEVIVEGGETRLMPVFWGTNPPMIGPVRSSRDYFLDYSMEYDAIYTHVGWSPQAQKDIPKLGINNINGLYVGTEVFWDLTKDKGNWQDTYTSMEKLLNYAKIKKFALTTAKEFPFNYQESDAVPVGGKVVAKISISYSNTNVTSYEYDSTSGLYLRFRKGKPQMERVSGKQLTAKNILIQFTPNYDIKGDAKGRQEMNTVGSGKGWFITEGKAVEILWSKASRSAQTKISDTSGKPIVLNKGQTWIQITPVKAKVTLE